MRRTLILLVMLALATTGRSEISPRLDSLRIKTFTTANVPVLGTAIITTTVGNLAVNMAVDRVCRDFPALLKLDTVLIDSASEGGALPSDYREIGWCQYIMGDTLRVSLTQIQPSDLPNFMPTIKTMVQPRDKPYTSKYFYVLTDSRLAVYPKWIRPDTGLYLIQYAAIDTTLSTDSSETSILAKYRELIIYYAAAIIYEIKRDETWAAFYKAMYESYIPGAK